MKRLNGINKIKLAVFISGRGSNLINLIKFSLKKKSKFIIKLVISSNSKAKGINFANKYKINKKIVNYNGSIENDNLILKELKKNKIDTICLAGFMKILSKNLIKKFDGKIFNIHPSLLPKYKGLNTHFRAIKNNEKFSGCTVHLVNSKLDSGKIILQKKVRVSNNETPKTLEKKILTQEHILYPKALNKFYFNR
tara:strand:- start:70 stop:654 length:585 start_codon:yes stop_codon:yes gene_type:complete